MWQTWAYSLVFVQLACWYTDVSSWSGGQLWRLLPFHRRKHFWCAHTFPAHFQCSHRVVLVPFKLHNLQPTSGCCLILESHLATWMVPAIAIISWLYVFKGYAGRSNTSLRTLCFHFAVTWSLPSTCLMQDDWYFSGSALACTHDFKNFLYSIQVFCCKTFTILWYNALCHCLCVKSSMSSPVHHLTYCCLSVLICLQAPVSLSSCFGTSFSAAPLRILSLKLLLNVEWRSW